MLEGLQIAVLGYSKIATLAPDGHALHLINKAIGETSSFSAEGLQWNLDPHMNFSAQEQMVIWVLASILGLIPATIASRKGRSFGLWWLYGSMLFIVALFHSLLIKPQSRGVERLHTVAAEVKEAPAPEGIKKCAFCDQLIDIASIQCPVCKGVQPM